ncbi:MAG: hypothetical protein WC477_03060 [Patescibacteria group bacterium]
MPKYPVEKILALYPEDERKAAELFQSQEFDSSRIDQLVAEFRNEDKPFDTTREVLLTMLGHIPPDKQRRVINRIQIETQGRGFYAENLCWWDINPQWRNLCFTLHRSGYEIPVTLMWRKTDPDAPALFNPSNEWIKDLDSLVGFRKEFHAEFYQHLRPQFLAWLDAPIQFPIENQPSLSVA